jgi:hypothetical protein
VLDSAARNETNAIDSKTPSAQRIILVVIISSVSSRFLLTRAESRKAA